MIGQICNMLCSCLLGKMSTLWKNVVLVTLNQWNYELALTYITIGIYTVSCLNLILLYIFHLENESWTIIIIIVFLNMHCGHRNHYLLKDLKKSTFFHLKCFYYPILHNIVNLEIWMRVPTFKSRKIWRNVEWRMLNYFLLYNINL